MKRRILYYLAANVTVLMLFSSGCTKDFEEINTNPNSPGIEQSSPSMLLTNAIESMTDRVHEIFFGHEMGSCWVQHMAKVQYLMKTGISPVWVLSTIHGTAFMLHQVMTSKTL
jgi:hypothetical protein